MASKTRFKVKSENAKRVAGYKTTIRPPRSCNDSLKALLHVLVAFDEDSDGTCGGNELRKFVNAGNVLAQKAEAVCNAAKKKQCGKNDLKNAEGKAVVGDVVADDGSKNF